MFVYIFIRERLSQVKDNVRIITGLLHNPVEENSHVRYETLFNLENCHVELKKNMQMLI